MEELIQNLKLEIIESLNLEDMTPDQIEADTPLFVEGLGLDSIDALELIVLLEKKYGLKIDTAEEGKRILYSVRSMAEHIVRHRNT
jgi:acyl carrier protein